MRLINKISNVFLLITIICFIVSIRMIQRQGLLGPPLGSSDRFELYVLIAIPLLFAGITFTLKILNKALTDQSISFMKMMADSKEMEKKS